MRKVAEMEETEDMTEMEVMAAGVTVPEEDIRKDRRCL
jgi:hypothetical protein